MSMEFCNSCRRWTASRPMMNTCVPSENPGCDLNLQKPDSEGEDFRQPKRRATGRPPRRARAPTMPTLTGPTQMPSSAGSGTGYPPYAQGGYRGLSQGEYNPYPSGLVGGGPGQPLNQWQPRTQTVGAGKSQTYARPQLSLPIAPVSSIGLVNSGAFAQGYNQLQPWQSGEQPLYNEPMPLNSSMVPERILTPIDDSRSMLAAHWKQSRQETSNDESDQLVDNDGRDAEGRYPCPHEGCDVTYAFAFGLEAHIHTSHTVGSTNNRTGYFKCPEPNCGQVYTRKAHLNNHIERFHPQDPNNPAATRIKQKRNYDSGTFLCLQPNCGKTFVKVDSLKAHSTKIHGVDFSQLRQGGHTPNNGPPTMPAVSALSSPITLPPASYGIAPYETRTGYDAPPTNPFPRPIEPRGRTSQVISRNDRSKLATQSESRSNSQNSIDNSRSRSRDQNQATDTTKARASSASPGRYPVRRINTSDSENLIREATSRMANVTLREQNPSGNYCDAGSSSGGNKSSREVISRSHESKKKGSMGIRSKDTSKFKP